MFLQKVFPLNLEKLQRLEVEWDFLAHSVGYCSAGPILSVFTALIVHSELKSVHPGFPVAFIF